ncbi:hypothetical protein UFOVP1247_64 [uncultured Caudovirales phage]|jgi:hypothetical protein|uniref:Uncharacterized protein n=1 Tax=uncultured Caudovirales phage TaxID=2100421 RepID=A0A6J5RMF2_9CAUD|nr:hypothetical protein UFOVP970_104 [uncultured Caudovirales phage]CAB4193365.1 hypothetical protein UFOVP1247_64 [uncultured Caudovirales phage]
MSKETLEEAAERLFPDSSIQKRIFIWGAKWQQDQDINKHNEEEPDIICGMCGGNAALCDGC